MKLGLELLEVAAEHTEGVETALSRWSSLESGKKPKQLLPNMLSSSLG